MDKCTSLRTEKSVLIPLDFLHPAVKQPQVFPQRSTLSLLITTRGTTVLRRNGLPSPCYNLEAENSIRACLEGLKVLERERAEQGAPRRLKFCCRLPAERAAEVAGRESQAPGHERGRLAETASQREGKKTHELEEKRMRCLNCQKKQKSVTFPKASAIEVVFVAV